MIASSRACHRPRCPCNGSVHRRSRSVEQAKADSSTRYRQQRAAFLARPENQRCALRIARHCDGKANSIDHIIAPKGRMDLYYDVRNWRPSCTRCNAAREIQEGHGLDGSWHQRRSQGRRTR